MSYSGMFTTPQNKDNILKQYVSSKVKASCDDMAKWLDNLLSSVIPFNSKTNSNVMDCYLALHSQCKQIITSSDMDVMETKTSEIFDDVLAPLLEELAQDFSQSKVKEDLHTKWRRLLERLLFLTVDNIYLGSDTRTRIKLKGEALYIVQLFGKPSKKDFEKVCDVQASKKNSSDSESLYDADCEEGPHTPNIKVQTQFKSKPDLIMVEKKIKEGDERDTCIVEIKTTRTNTDGNLEICDTDTVTSSTCTSNSAVAKTKALNSDGKSQSDGNSKPVRKKKTFKETAPNSRLYQIDKQHFFQLFSGLKKAGEDDRAQFRIFGLYICMSKIYPTALSVNVHGNKKGVNVHGNKKGVTETIIRAHSFLKQDSYISEPPTALDNAHGFNMVVGPYFELFKPGHLRAFLDYMCIVNKCECEYLHELSHI